MQLEGINCLLISDNIDDQIIFPKLFKLMGLNVSTVSELPSHLAGYNQILTKEAPDILVISYKFENQKLYGALDINSYLQENDIFKPAVLLVDHFSELLMDSLPENMSVIRRDCSLTFCSTIFTNIASQL